MKINKRQRINFFTYYGWTIPLFLVGFWVTFYFIYNNVYAPKKYEKLVMFYAAYNLKDNSIHKEMKNALKPYGCLEVDYYDYSLTNPEIAKYYNTLKPNTDLFVMSEQDLTDMKEEISGQYMKLSNIILDKIHIPTTYQYYSYDETTYGIKIYDKNDNDYNQFTKFQNWINFSFEDKTDNFYLVINCDSVNFDDEKGHTLGYKGLEYLLNGSIQ